VGTNELRILPRTSMLPAIPQKLSDMILDFLHCDAAALRSAGLVCKSWLPRSRFHLFSDICWKLGHHDHVLELICAERSTIPPHILTLILEGNESQYLDETLLMLPILGNVKHLHLSQIDMANLKPDAKMKLTTMLKNLTTLYLFAFTVRNYYFFALPWFTLTHLWILDMK
jgi:hypothetical protein